MFTCVLIVHHVFVIQVFYNYYIYYLLVVKIPHTPRMCHVSCKVVYNGGNGGKKARQQANENRIKQPHYTPVLDYYDSVRIQPYAFQTHQLAHMFHHTHFRSRATTSKFIVLLPI